MKRNWLANKYIFLFLFIFTLPSSVFAQNTLKGKVLKAESNKPVFWANVYLKNHLNTGTATNLKGRFILKIPEGQRSDTLIISSVGYRKLIIPLSSVYWKKVNVFLISKATESLSTITVSSRSSITKEFSTKTLDPLQIALSPVSDDDPLKAITLLPASTNTSENANPEFRGSAAGYSRVMLNGSPLYNPVQFSQLNGLGGFSILSTALLDHETIYAGNPPLKYGNSIAGLVDVKSKNRIKAENFSIAGGLSRAGLLFQAPVKKKTRFVQLFGNIQFSGPYLAVNNITSPYLNKFGGQNIGLNFHNAFSGRLLLNTYSYFTNNRYNVRNFVYNYSGNIHCHQRRYFNVFNLKYTARHIVFSFNNEFNISSSDYTFGNIHSVPNKHEIFNALRIRYISSGKFSFAAGLVDNYFNYRFSGRMPVHYFGVFPDDPAFHLHRHQHHSNIEAYGYGRYAADKLTIGAGLRKNVPINAQKGYISYQGSLRYDFLAHSSLHFSAGNYRGYTVPHFYIRRFRRVSATQFALGYRYQSNRSTFGITFYKNKEHTPRYFSEFGASINSDRQTEQNMKGIEVSEKYQLTHFTFYASYTWLNSKFRKGNRWIRNSNDMNYLIKAAVSYLSLKYVNFSIDYIARPGHFYTPVDDAVPVKTTSGFRPIFGTFNSRQLNGYSRLDLSLNKLIYFKGGRIIPFLTLTNILNRKNHAFPIYKRNFVIANYRYYSERLIYVGVQVSL
jgi:hypothetical protein